MKRLNLTKEQFNRSRFLKKRYGALKYVSESGRFFKTTKGKVLMFKESEQFLPSISDVNPEAREDDGSGTIIYSGCKINSEGFWDEVMDIYYNSEEYQAKYPTMLDWANSEEGYADINDLLETYTRQGDDINDFGEPYDESASPWRCGPNPCELAAAEFPNATDSLQEVIDELWDEGDGNGWTTDMVRELVDLEVQNALTKKHFNVNEGYERDWRRGAADEFRAFPSKKPGKWEVRSLTGCVPCSPFCDYYDSEEEAKEIAAALTDDYEGMTDPYTIKHSPQVSDAISDMYERAARTGANLGD